MINLRQDRGDDLGFTSSDFVAFPGRPPVSEEWMGDGVEEGAGSCG